MQYLDLLAESWWSCAQITASRLEPGLKLELFLLEIGNSLLVS